MSLHALYSIHIFSEFSCVEMTELFPSRAKVVIAHRLSDIVIKKSLSRFGKLEDLPEFVAGSVIGYNNSYEESCLLLIFNKEVHEFAWSPRPCISI